MPTLTVRQWLYLALALTLLAGGYYFRDSLQMRKDFSNVKSQVKTLQKQGRLYDDLVSDNIDAGNAIDQAVHDVIAARQELETHDSQYREYLDRPLPEQSLRLYRDAAKAVDAVQRQGADDAGAATE